jgi:hypothetical protein
MKDQEAKLTAWVCHCVLWCASVLNTRQHKTSSELPHSPVKTCFNVIKLCYSPDGWGSSSASRVSRKK